jgi:hypothetical protein
MTVRSFSDSRPWAAGTPSVAPRPLNLADAEKVLAALADLHFQTPRGITRSSDAPAGASPPRSAADDALPILEARYQTLLEQISAIVFMAYLDRGIGEGYVSPQIEATLGFSQQEWLEDPIR